MRRHVFLAVVLLAVGVAPLRADDEACDSVKAALVAAVSMQDGVRLKKALDDADALVGSMATFPDLGALADWFSTLPGPVATDPAVEARRAWMYLVSRRGADAIELVSKRLAKEPTHPLFLAYLGEAKRQTGDVSGALDALYAAMKAGATDEAVVPSVEKLVFDLRAFPPRDGAAARAAQVWTTVAAKLFELRPMIGLRLRMIDWLVADLARATSDAPRAFLLSMELTRQLAAVSKLELPEGEGKRLARLAFDAAMRWKGVAQPPSSLGDPTPFDVFAVAVRLGERASGEGHELPEALAELAEEALAKGRYVLADRLARRRLAISDSPTARRVLRALPADVGD